MAQRVCKCGLLFTTGRPAFGDCPRCAAIEAAEAIQAEQAEPFGDATAALSAITLIMHCVAEWPQILIPGDSPGYCEGCGALVNRRWDCLCGRCLDLKADEEASEWLHDRDAARSAEGLASYADKHG